MATYLCASIDNLPKHYFTRLVHVKHQVHRIKVRGMCRTIVELLHHELAELGLSDLAQQLPPR